MRLFFSVTFLLLLSTLSSSVFASGVTVTIKNTQPTAVTLEPIWKYEKIRRCIKDYPMSQEHLKIKTSQQFKLSDNSECAGSDIFKLTTSNGQTCNISITSTGGILELDASACEAFIDKDDNSATELKEDKIYIS